MADYLALTWRLAGAATADSVYRLVHEELADPFEFLRSALAEVGVAVRLTLRDGSTLDVACPSHGVR